jgi:hypothetical protein
MPDRNQILYAVEVHSVEGIRSYFEEGGSYKNQLKSTVQILTALSISRFPGAPGAFSTLQPNAFNARFKFPVIA